MLSRSQIRGHVTNTARSGLRWAKVRDISDAGGTKADACAATGLSLEGLNTLIRKHKGNQNWPIQENA